MKQEIQQNLWKNEKIIYYLFDINDDLQADTNSPNGFPHYLEYPLIVLLETEGYSILEWKQYAWDMPVGIRNTWHALASNDWEENLPKRNYPLPILYGKYKYKFDYLPESDPRENYISQDETIYNVLVYLGQRWFLGVIFDLCIKYRELPIDERVEAVCNDDVWAENFKGNFWGYMMNSVAELYNGASPLFKNQLKAHFEEMDFEYKNIDNQND